VGVLTITSRQPPELLHLVRAQLARLPEFAAELAELLSEKEEFYRHVNATAPDELRKVCEVNLRHAFTAFVDGTDITLDVVRKTGLAQAELGVPLSAVLRAFRLAGTFTYETLMDALPPGQFLPVSNTVWRIIDFYSDAIATAYRDLETDSTRDTERARLAAIDGLFNGAFTEQSELDSAAGVLNLPPAGRFVVLFGDGIGDLPRWRVVRRGTSDGEIGIVAVDPTADLRELSRALNTLPHGVGMSPPVTGLRRLPNALRRARIARRCLAPGATGVAGFGDRPLTTLVAGAAELAAELAREVLAGVLALPPAERDVLLATLHAWYDESGSAKAAAERLFVHPNTVRYRVRRVQELTGRDLADPRGSAELYAAVESVRLNPPR
jgi:hypothetical protein